MTTQPPSPENAPSDPTVTAQMGDSGPADVSANGEAAETVPSIEERVAALEAKNAELSDAYLRARADVENTRRRSEEEVSKARKFAVENFAEALLPVRDSLEAALALPNATQAQMKEGVEATLRQLTHAMERNKVLQIKPESGAKFDPHQHQAISVVPADQEANTVVSVLQPGYLIAERVLRPALITVAAPK